MSSEQMDRGGPPVHLPGGVPPKKGNKEINKEKKTKQIFIGDVFSQKLGLDAILGSWDLKIRIPRRKLRI